MNIEEERRKDYPRKRVVSKKVFDGFQRILDDIQNKKNPKEKSGDSNNINTGS